MGLFNIQRNGKPCLTCVLCDWFGPMVLYDSQADVEWYQSLRKEQFVTVEVPYSDNPLREMSVEELRRDYLEGERGMVSKDKKGIIVCGSVDELFWRIIP